MDNFIVNSWHEKANGVMVALILAHDTCPEGLDFSRWRFPSSGSVELPSEFACICSVVHGRGILFLGECELEIGTGVHFYLPPGMANRFRADPETELVVVAAAESGRAQGEQFLLRDEEFLAACGHESGVSRWILTPQYRSRRVFLHHDKTLLSRAGHPLSWFHTTMFDVDGLPANQDGESVFKMSYNYRTEPNLCYEVAGRAAVRVAKHPYSKVSQEWEAWRPLDGETTYHLNEGEINSEYVQVGGKPSPLRNKHEVKIEGGHVSLLCMHDPAPTGAETHSQGEYSAYGDLGEILGSAQYKQYLHVLKPLDEMVDTLSIAKAEGRDWRSLLAHVEVYELGLAARDKSEAQLRAKLSSGNSSRIEILSKWMA